MYGAIIFTVIFSISATLPEDYANISGNESYLDNPFNICKEFSIKTGSIGNARFKPLPKFYTDYPLLADVERHAIDQRHIEYTSPVKLIAMGGLYGALAGVLVGGAILLIDKDIEDKWDVMRISTGIGILGGLAIGAVEAIIQPRPMMSEISDGVNPYCAKGFITPKISIDVSRLLFK